MKGMRQTTQIRLALALVAVGALGWILLPSASELEALQSNFQGGAPQIMDATGLQTLRLRFPAGVRTSWHTHNDGQLLMVESGRARTQVRGGPVQEFGPGQPWYTPGGVEHWHGAAPEVEVVQWTIYDGNVNWLTPTTDAEYRGAPGR